MESLKRRMIRAFVAAIALLAVGLLIACQGPAGPAGAAGGKGDPGTAGSPGSPGSLGISALEAVGGAGHASTVAVYISNTDLGEIGPLPTIDLTDYFRGGKAQVTFTVAAAPPAGSTFNVSITKGSTRSPPWSCETRPRRTPQPMTTCCRCMPTGSSQRKLTSPAVTYFTVKATDADGFTAMKTLAVLANGKRRYRQSSPPSFSPAPMAGARTGDWADS